MIHTKKIILSSAMFSVLLFASSISYSDWQGNFTVKVTGERKVPEASGIMHMKKDKLRMDTKTPAEVSTIVHLNAKKAWSLLHTQKMMMEVDLATIESQAPICAAADVDACLKKRGFKKIGAEEMNGHSCTVYEGAVFSKAKEDKKVHVKLWRPNDLKEVPAVRTVTSEASNTTVDTNFTEIETITQSDSLFMVPQGYHSMGNPQDLLKNLSKGLGGIKIPGQ